MPIYEYRCIGCGRSVDVIHSIDGSGPETCEVCGAAMRKALSAPAIVFKGSGWAKKDARAGSSPAGVGASAKDTGSSDGAAGSSDGSGSSDGAAGPGSSGTETTAAPAATGTGSAKTTSTPAGPAKPAGGSAPAGSGDRSA